MPGFTIATRGSKLALYQATFVQTRLRQAFPEQDWEIQTFTTTGDRFLDRPLSSFGGKGAFLKELEEALLSGKADLAVHSLKDVPCTETAGLVLAAFLSREDPRDVWASHQEDLMHLPAGKTVGTSSLRRKVLIGFYRPDLKVDLLRGNLDTRLRKLREGNHDAIVVAAAGLHRLQLFQEDAMQYLQENAFIPAIGQGIMVIQTRNDSKVRGQVFTLNDPMSESQARIERGFLSYFEGGCHLPIGGYAKFDGSRWHFHAFIGGVRSGKIVQDAVVSASGEDCASRMYKQLMKLGAKELLAEL